MSAGADHRLGVACVLGASVLWGTTGTASALAPAVTPLAVGAALAAAALGLLVVLGFTGRAFVDSWQNLAVGAYLSVVQPAVAAVLAVVVGERLPLAGWAGMAVIIACLAVLTVPLPARAAVRRRAPAEPLEMER